MNTAKNVQRIPVNNNINGCRLGSGGSLGDRRSRIIAPQSAPDTTKSHSSETPIERLFRFVRPQTYTFLKDNCYASVFNSWLSLYTMSAHSEAFTTVTPQDMPLYYRCTVRAAFTTPHGILRLQGSAIGSMQKEARENAYFDVIRNYAERFPTAQMDTEQGDAIQKSDQHSNTIITRDASQTISEEQNVDPISLPIVCSTEPTHQFDSVMNRWMALDGLEIPASKKTNDIIATYNLPSFLYASNKAPNLMPFENFIYGTYNIEFKFVVNANKFHVGKVLCSVKYDSYQMEERRNNVVSALCRPHVILDLAVNNEGTLSVPFKYHRTFVRNTQPVVTQFGVKYAQYATVTVQILSPLGAISDAAQSMFIRPFFRIKKADLTGMSYRVPLTQMDDLNLESLLKIVGSISNLDRPTDLNRQMQVIPKTRLHFCAGKAPIDSVPMRMDPSTLTTYLEDHKYPEDPTDMMQIARIWGLAFAFDWKTSHTEGAELVSQKIDPTYHCNTSFTGVPTPLEYVSSMYQFWSGPIEIRLDFVSNAFHSGSVMLSAEFGRESDDLVKSSSTYTKTFHLGDQKSCTFTIPYIYDTPYRRTSCTPWMPIGVINNPEQTVTRLGQNALYQKINGRFKVRVINKLVPIQSTTQTIQVLVYWRGGDNYTCHSPIMANLINNEVAGKLDSFPGEYPLTQMDDGSKEDLDPTHDFNQGVKRDHVMSVDKHTNIKDLLRRPVQIMTKQKGVKYFTPNADQAVAVFYVPCMPPSRMCGLKQKEAKSDGVPNGPYSYGLQYSYHSHILDLFRFWRGSQRFTFLFHTNKTVFVSYVPHSGSRVVGTTIFNKTNLIGGSTGWSSTNPSTMGLPTEIVIPSINPSVIIEAPYELENNFALMQEQWSEDNYSWRDKGDTNTGHLILWSNEDFSFDAWWSAGDDFEVNNFYGIPPCKSFAYPFIYEDSYPRTQMDDEEFMDAQDFPTRESSESSSNLTYYQRCKQFISPFITPISIAAVSQVPIVGPTIAYGTMIQKVGSVTDTAHQALEQIHETTTHVQNMTGNIAVAAQSATLLANTTTKAIEDLAAILSLRNIQDSASDVIKLISDKIASFVEVGSQIYHVVLDVVIDILINIANFNYSTLALSVVRFMANITGFAFLKLTTYIEELTNFFKTCFAATTQGDLATEHLSASFWNEDVLKQGLGLFVGIIGTAAGIVVDKKHTDGWTSTIFKRLTTSGGMSFLNGSMRFVETIFLMIKEAIFWILRYTSIENKALMSLRDKSKLIDNFVKESQLMLHEANIANIQNPEFKIRFWTNVVNAYEIQKMLATVPTNKVAPILARTCNDVIKVGRERMADLRSSPVRYEPFVVCIEGPSKIGKSFATTPLATELLHAIGYKSSSNNPIYYRIQGSRFWNDYIDQPCVVLDEWMNLSDSQSVLDGVRELFQLKSPAVFIPEQAAIEEKKIRANPKLVIILTNTPFPDHLLGNAVTCPEAVYRRRDILLRATLKEDAKNIDLHSMSKEDKVALKHLQFQVYSDSTQVSSLEEDKYTYDSMLAKLKEQFIEYDRNESENVKIRMAQLQKFWQVKTINMTDPFSLFYEGTLHTSQAEGSSALPSEILEVEVARLANAIESIEASSSAPAPPETQGFLATGIITAVGVMATRALVNYITNFKQPLPVDANMCCICQETVESYACCTQSYTQYENNGSIDCLHILCRTCCVTNTAIGTSGCPMCRDPRYLMVVPSETAALFKGIWKLKKLGHKIQPYLQLLSPKIVLSLFWFMDILNNIDKGMEPADTTTLVGWAKVGVTCVLETIAIGMVRQSVQNVDDHITAMEERTLRENMREFIEAHIIARRSLNDNIPDEDIRMYRETGICPHAWVGTRNEHAPALQHLPANFPRSVREITDRDIEQFNLSQYNYTPAPPSRERIRTFSGSEHVMSQMDNASTINHRRLIFTHRNNSSVDDMNYHFNQTKFQEEWENLEISDRVTGDSLHQTCFHAGMIDEMAGASWEDGAFQIPTMTAYRRVEWKKCKNFCLLDSMDKEAICRAYFDYHKAMDYIYITNHYHTEEFKQNFSKRLPSFMIPHWLDVQAFTIRDTEEAWLAKLSIPPVLLTLLKAVGVAVSVFITFKGVKALCSMLFGANPSSQIISSGDAVIRKFKPEVRKLNHSIVRPQGGCEDAIMSKVVSNYFVLTIKHQDTSTVIQCVGLGIKQRIGLMPRHYYNQLRKLDPTKSVITLGPAINYDHGIPYTFCESDFLVSEVSDLAVFYLPISYNMFKDITKYFGTDSDLNGKYSPLAQMIRVPTRTEKYVSVVELQLKGYKKTQTIVGADGAFTSLDCLEYNYSQAGACGSAIMVHNHTRPIRGIHIAGQGKLYGGVGYAALVTQEDLEVIPTASNTVHAQSLEEPEFLSEPIKLYLPVESKVTYKGAVDKKLTPYASDKSGIKPSLIAESLPWQTTKAPAILSKKDPRYKHDLSPLVAGCAKHGYLTKDFSSQQLEEVAEIRRDQLLAHAPLILNPQRLTINEAVVGIPQHPHYEGIKMNTSAGWPYCTTTKTTKEHWTTIIRDDQEQPIDCEVHEDVVKEVHRKEQLRKQGIVPMTLFVDTLKDEKKSLTKIPKLGSTRVFCSSPYDFTISMRQNFLHFVATYYENRDALKHSVGISMVGREVTQLVTDLLSVGNNIITLDYSNFGPGFNASVAGTFKKTICAWVNEYVQNVDPVELECLIEENINSHHLMMNTVYQQRGGSPSGSPLTVVINSEENISYIMLAWLNLVDIKEGNRWDEFDRHVVLRVYGDDLIMSVADKYIDQFNGETIMAFFKQYGIVATDAAKSSSILKYTSIYEASYLKHTFHPHPTRSGEWIAALDMESVRDTPLWIQEPIQIADATRINAEAAIRNAYGHGPIVFNEFKNEINRALRKHKIAPILLSWQELDENFYKN